MLQKLAKVKQVCKIYWGIYFNLFYICEQLYCVCLLYNFNAYVPLPIYFQCVIEKQNNVANDARYQ